MKTCRFVVLCLFLGGCYGGTPTPRATSPATPPAAAKALYDRLGGEPAITKVVDDLVAIVIADPRIKEVHKKHFMTDEVAALKRKLIDQIGEATGGPQKYLGKNMKDAHLGMKITDADFDALADDVAQALDRNGVGAAEKKQLLDMLAAMRKDVVEAPQ